MKDTFVLNDLNDEPRKMSCKNIIKKNYSVLDKVCDCGWGRADEENVLNLSRFLSSNLICPVCKEKTYFLAPLLMCAVTNKLCIEYDCELYL